MPDNVIHLHDTPLLKEFSGQAQTTDWLLKIQCDLSFDQELKLLRRAGLKNGVSILDLGCGNGAYLQAIEAQLPGVQCVGLERDPVLADRARARMAQPDLVFTGTTPEAIPQAVSCDIVLARYLALHLTDLALLGDMLRRRGTASASLMLIDAADCYFEINRPMPLFTDIIERLWSSAGVNRSLHADLSQLERRAKLATIWRKDIVIHSDLPGRKEQFLLYMLLNAIFAHHGDLPVNVRDELLDWYFDTGASAQYGLFGALMKSEGEKRLDAG